jgi:hypothetical protein
MLQSVVVGVIVIHPAGDTFKRRDDKMALGGVKVAARRVDPQ